jgi:hypothetical protein
MRNTLLLFFEFRIVAFGGGATSADTTSGGPTGVHILDDPSTKDLFHPDAVRVCLCLPVPSLFSINGIPHTSISSVYDLIYEVRDFI